MKSYLLAIVMLLLTIPSLASAEERRLVKAGPPGKHGPVWKYVEKAEPNEACVYEASSLKKKVRPNVFRHKGIPG